MRRSKKEEGKVEESLSDASTSQPPASSTLKPSVAVVGAGRLGTALARALVSSGYRVAAVVARRRLHARRASEAIGGHAAALIPAELEQLPAAGLLFITTPDDIIASTAARLAASVAASPGRVALHASGALSSDVLAPLRERGFGVGSMHPLVAVSDARAGAESLRAAFYCIEGDAAALRVARRVVRDLDGQSFSIATKDKALYHAAAVMTSGHAVALFDLASELLARCGPTKTQARRVLLPLVRSTLENLSTQPPSRALTGTFARADVATVRKHLKALDAPNSDLARAVYTLLGLHSLRLAEENGADAAALKEISSVLDEARSKKRRVE